jgi:hypothetical protein
MSTMAPECQCPVCGRSFYDMAYFEMSEGSETHCPHCETQLEVSEVEYVMFWKFKKVGHGKDHLDP